MSATAETVNNELAIPDPKTPIKLGLTKAALGKLQKKYNKVPDATTEDGYKAIVEAKRELVPLRTAVEKEAKVQKAAAQDHLKKINAVQNHIIATIKAIEEPLYAAKKEVDDQKAKEKREAEEKEERRVLVIEGKVEDIQELAEGLLGADLKALEERLAEANKITITDKEYMEFVEPASQVLGQIKTQLTNAVNVAKEQASQQKSIDSQKAESTIREAIAAIKMVPVDAMGGSAEDIEDVLNVLDILVIGDDYGDLKNEAVEAREAALSKLKSMIEMQRGLDKQQADLDQQKQEQEDQAAENERKESDRLAEEQRKKNAKKEADDAKAKKKELAARMPEDQKLRAYGRDLETVIVPFIDDTALLTIQSRATTMVEDKVKFINENTQDEV